VVNLASAPQPCDLLENFRVKKQKRDRKGEPFSHFEEHKLNLNQETTSIIK